MAEYTSSGIWVVEPHGPFRHGMVSHRALGLPGSLAAGFAAWIAAYDARIEDPSGFDVEAFNASGRALAVALRRHVGAGCRVLFVPERPDGGLGPEEELAPEA